MKVNGCRGGFGGGGERVLFINLSDFDIDTDEDERNKTVFKLEFLFNDKVLFIGNVDEPFVTRRFLRLETLYEKKKQNKYFRKFIFKIHLSNAFGFLPLASINKPFGTISLLSEKIGIRVFSN